jgi:DNA polymerase III subunit chi
VTSIDFYFNASDRIQVACRLAAKALARRQPLLIYAPDADIAARIDKTLWTWPATGFVPHCAVSDALAAQTPVLIARDEQAPEHVTVLLNLSEQEPPHFARFERLLEIVGTDPAEREVARKRFREYQSHGYAIANHDLAKAADE